MKLLVLVLMSFLLEAHCGVLVSPESKESGADLEQWRSVRVHRVASDNFHAKNIVDMESTEQTFPPDSRRNDVSLADTVVSIPSTQNEASKPPVSVLTTEFPKHMESVSRVLNELSREMTAATRNDDLEFNGMTETVESPVSIKSLPKNVHVLRNLLDSPERMDISYLDNLGVGKKTESGPKLIGETNDFQLRVIKIVGLYIDRLLTEIQDHATYIQNIIKKFCRKHRSKTPPQPEVDSSRNLP